ISRPLSLHDALPISILQANCNTCHAASQSPFIGHEDPEAAFNAILNNNKVDLNDIPGSRLVARLATDSHQCWSNDCAKDAAEMRSEEHTSELQSREK